MAHSTLPLWPDATDTQKLDKLCAMVDDLYRYHLAAHIGQAIEILEAHNCEDDKERADVQRIITLARAHPNIFSPLCEVGHITGSALVVHVPTQRVLLNHHRKFNRWMQFGGHMDNDLAPHLTALREAREETGLRDVQFVSANLSGLDIPRPFDIDVHVVPQRGDRPEHLHLDLRYLVTTDQPEQAQVTDESNDIRWFTQAELNTLDLEPSLWRMIRKTQRHI
jgi:8-oxo-dGTP pyrophosphatase MutT (NUDIX family)